jgi:hypothetical protein
VLDQCQHQELGAAFLQFAVEDPIDILHCNILL